MSLTPVVYLELRISPRILEKIGNGLNDIIRGLVKLIHEGNLKSKSRGTVPLTRFRRTSDGDVIPGPEQGFEIVGGYFSAALKSFLSHSLNMHFPLTRSSMAFLKIKVMLIS